MANKQRSTKTKRTARQSRQPRARKLVTIENVRLSKEHPAATVSFKSIKGDQWRVSARRVGLPRMFVRVTERGAEARIRGENPVAARTADKAFAKGVKHFWA